MSYPNVNMIVCVAGDNLMGDKNPAGNGLLWNCREELLYFKEKTLGNVVIFGKNTAKYVPLELMKKNRDVVVLSSGDNFSDILEKYKDSDKEIFICGGLMVYKYFLENFPMDNIYFSVLKPNVEIKSPENPLYFPKLEDYGYRVASKKEYENFVAYTYKK